MYAKIENGQVVETTTNIRKKFPNTSFPEGVTEHEGWVKVEGKAAPAAGKEVSTQTIEVVNSKPVRSFTYKDKEPDDLEVRLKALEDKAGVTAADKTKARNALKGRP